MRMKLGKKLFRSRKPRSESRNLNNEGQKMRSADSLTAKEAAEKCSNAEKRDGKCHVKSSSSDKWKLPWLWNWHWQWRWRNSRVNLSIPGPKDIMWKIVSVLESIVLVTLLSFFFLCCGCSI